VDYLLLGPMVVSRNGEVLPIGGLRQRSVLAALLLDADRSVEIDQLIERVWHDAAPPKPVASLRAYVANLRRILGEEVRLVTEAKGYRLHLGGHRLDTREFEALISDGRRLLDAGGAAEAGRTLARALALWRGAPLSDFRDQPFTHHEVHRLEALRADAVETRFEAELRLGRNVELVSELESEVAGNPMRERLWGQLMLALYRSGRRTDALGAYSRVEAVLDEELGVRPGLALERLANEIRNESADLDWQQAQSGAVRVHPKVRRQDTIFGRSRELQRLQAALTAASEGRGGVAVLTGDRGVGKTALATEVANLADDLGMATVWAGHSGEARRPPSWAWTHALRGLAGQVGHHAKDRALTTVPPEWWRQATVSGAATGSETHSAFEVAQATATAVTELAGKWPAVIVLDDLHRSDRMTRDVLELLAASVHRVPLLILATWQDGGADRPVRARAFDRLLSRSDIATMTLRGIDDAGTAALIEDLCGAVPRPEFVAAVRSRTGGNPFYIRELTRLLHDDGRLDDTTRDIAGDDVPDAVSGIIRRRMADLPRATRTVLTEAAVLGIEFGTSRLAAALHTTVAAVAIQLEAALVAGLIGETADHPGRYRFSHGLVRDAIVAQLSGVARAKMHADFAHVYAADPAATSSQDAIDGGEHAWRAGGELDAAAALLLVDRARTDAWARSAYLEIAELDRRALDICSRLPVGAERVDRESDLRLQLASVEAVVSGQSSVKVLDDLRRSAEADSDAAQYTTVVAMGCLEACGSGRYHEAAVLSDGLIAFYQKTRDALSGSAGFYIRALSEFMRGRLDSSLQSLETLQADVPTVDWERFGALASFEVISFGVAAHVHALRGDLDSADSSVSAGIALGASRSDAFGVAVVRTADIQRSAMLGTAAGLAQRADEVLDELSGLGIDQFVPGACIIGGWARAMGPDGIDTVDEMRDALAMHAQGGRRIFTPLYYALLADAEAAHRDSGAARASLRQAEQVAKATGEKVWDTQLSARKLTLRADSVRPDAMRG
jgi:DNA-binding SARP family transcriptional activator